MIFLIRGLPGSGKTTFAKRYVQSHPDFVHIESDSWFESDGVYKFKPELTLAHRYCALRCEDLVKQGRNVIVSNTFMHARECMPYFVIAKKYDIDINIMICMGEYGSIHGIPPEKVEQMKLRFQEDETVLLIADKDLGYFYNDPYDAYNHF